MCVWVCVCVCVCVFCSQKQIWFRILSWEAHFTGSYFWVWTQKSEMWLDTKTENLQRFLPAKLNYDNYSFKEDYFILEVLHAFYSKCQSFNSNKVYRLSLMELNTYYNNFKRNSRALWVIGTFSHVFLRNYIPS